MLEFVVVYVYAIDLLIKLEAYIIIMQMFKKNKDKKRNNCTLILQNTLKT